MTLAEWTQNWQQSWELLPITANSTPGELIAANTPALSQMRKNNVGGMMGETIFKMAIRSIVSFSAHEKWTDAQVSQCASIAYSEYYWFTLAELRQFVMRVLTSYYVSNKNLMPPVLMEFLAEYSKEQLAHRYDYYSQLKPVSAKKFTLSIYKILNSKGKRFALFYCGCIQEASDRRMEDLKQKIGQMVQTQHGNTVDVVEARDMERQSYLKDQIKLVESAMVNGFAPDAQLYEWYLKAISK